MYWTVVAALGCHPTMASRPSKYPLAANQLLAHTFSAGVPNTLRVPSTPCSSMACLVAAAPMKEPTPNALWGSVWPAR